jgi:hypothetical protein
MFHFFKILSKLFPSVITVEVEEESTSFMQTIIQSDDVRYQYNGHLTVTQKHGKVYMNGKVVSPTPRPGDIVFMEGDEISVFRSNCKLN